MQSIEGGRRTAGGWFWWWRSSMEGRWIGNNRKRQNDICGLKICVFWEIQPQATTAKHSWSHSIEPSSHTSSTFTIRASRT
jgi:hypothetical protein